MPIFFKTNESYPLFRSRLFERIKISAKMRADGNIIGKMHSQKNTLSDGAARIAAVFAGGAIGSAARAAIVLPLGINPLASILLCNVLGSALYVFAGRIFGHKFRPLKDFAATGFCGGFTTFSTVCKDFVLYADSGEFFCALGIFAANLLLCTLSVHLIDAAADKYGKAAR